jgi:hypothetical protein
MDVNESTTSQAPKPTADAVGGHVGTSVRAAHHAAVPLGTIVGGALGNPELSHPVGPVVAGVAVLGMLCWPAGSLQ